MVNSQKTGSLINFSCLLRDRRVITLLSLSHVCLLPVPYSIPIPPSHSEFTYSLSFVSHHLSLLHLRLCPPYFFYLSLTLLQLCLRYCSVVSMYLDHSLILAPLYLTLSSYSMATSVSESPLLCAPLCRSECSVSVCSPLCL
jgi:hypothetical protein